MTKTISIMQPYIFPYLGYFQLLNLADIFIIYDDVNFIKKGWIHRNRILNNSEPLLFTVPLTDPSQNKLICETLLHPSYDAWKEKFLKTLFHNYKKAPHFEVAYQLIKKVLEVGKPGNSIGWLAQESISQVADYLAIKTKLVKTSRIYSNKDLKAQGRIINICQQEQATRYINPIGGLELYNSQDFKEIGIELLFAKTSKHAYKQFNDAFIPYLSIIDVIMFNDSCQIQTLLQQYELRGQNA